MSMTARALRKAVASDTAADPNWFRTKEYTR